MKSIVSKLLPEQISAFWDVIKYAIDQSLPPLANAHPDRMNRILSSALRGTIEIWAEYVKEEGKPPKFEGIALTQFLYDEPSGTKNMLIYALYGYNPIDPSSWARTLAVVTKYAKDKKCDQMVAYSSVPHIINLARGLGANTDFTFISFNVNEIVQKLNDLSE